MLPLPELTEEKNEKSYGSSITRRKRKRILNDENVEDNKQVYND
jgi:hypothetical protein